MQRVQGVFGVPFALFKGREKRESVLKRELSSRWTVNGRAIVGVALGRKSMPPVGDVVPRCSVWSGT